MIAAIAEKFYSLVAIRAASIEYRQAALKGACRMV